MSTLVITTYTGQTFPLSALRDAYRWCSFARRAARKACPEPSQLKDINIHSSDIIFFELQPSMLEAPQPSPPIYLKGKAFDMLDKSFVSWALCYKFADTVVKLEYLLSFFGYPPPALR